jgi:hypothetical protein
VDNVGARRSSFAGNWKLEADFHRSRDMTPMRIAGIVLIVIGIVGLVWGGFSWTRERTVLEIGGLKATAKERETIPLPPVVGGVALVAGIVLLVLPRRK